jgi:PAS domain S-box-containing protein
MTDSNKGLRILIVEDDYEDQDLLTELLHASVIKIQLPHTAETLAKAMDCLQKEIFDIIFLDLSLPDSSGIETFKTIKEHTGKTPVIILSGLADMNIAVEAISLGAQDYHIKGDLDEKTLNKTILYSIERKHKLENLREDNDRYITISKAELDLMQNEEITRRIINSALDGIICIDIYGKITVWNPQAEKIFGWKQHEILGKKLTDTIIPAEYRERHEQGMKHYVSTGEGPILNKLIEITAVNRAGQHFPVELSIVPLKEGGSQFFCAFLRDITEMKKAGTALKRSSDRFEMITRTTNDAVWEWDLETGKMWGNETHQQLYGLTTTDPVPHEKQWQERLHPDDRASLIKKQADALASDTNVFITEYRFNSEKKGYINIYDRCYIVRNAEGKAIRILGSMMDITERKKAEELIKESEGRYKALVENAPEALVVFDVESRKFVSVSESAERLFKMTREELLQIGPVEVSPEYQPDGRLSAEVAMKNISETIAGGKPSFEWTHCDKEGNPISCEVWLVRLPSETRTLIRGSIIDITVRKKAELKLKESEGKYRSAIEQATDFIMITDQQGNFTDANSSFCKTFGYSHEELLHLNINKVIDPEQLKIRPVRFDLLSKGETVLNQRRMLTRNGAIIDVEANVKMLPDGRIMAIARDIRERKKAEEQLSNERNLLRALIDHLPDYIYVKDTSFNYLINNRAFVKLVGAASEEENTRKNSIELFGEKIGQINMEEDKKIFETWETIIDRDEPILTRDGGNLWLLTTKVPLKDQENKVTGILGISKDITERKEAERIIKESEEKYRTMIEQAPDGIFIANREAFIVDVNTSGCMMTGYTKEELLKMKYTELVSPENLRNNPIRIDELNSGKIVLSERKLMRKDGSEILVEINAKLRSDGLVQSFLRDISERKKAEQELKESYKAIRKLTEHLQNIREEERAHMAREIHDELGQQLTVLKMDISWINKKMGIQDEPVKERMKELLVMLDETVKSVRRISSELRPSLLDDLGLIAAIEWQLTEFEKRFEIKTYFKPEDAEIKLPESIKTALFRILQESLTNVARHSKAKKVIVSLNTKNGSIVLSVADNGVGFDKQNTIGKKTLGILGMQERTSMMGGTYEISGKPGKGTRVIVTIPLVDSSKN